MKKISKIKEYVYDDCSDAFDMAVMRLYYDVYFKYIDEPKKYKKAKNSIYVKTPINKRTYKLTIIIERDDNDL